MYVELYGDHLREYILLIFPCIYIIYESFLSFNFPYLVMYVRVINISFSLISYFYFIIAYIIMLIWQQLLNCAKSVGIIESPKWKRRIYIHHYKSSNVGFHIVI